MSEMTPLRTRLEQALRKHGISCAELNECCETLVEDAEFCKQLAVDLLACVPQPSREALTGILHFHKPRCQACQGETPCRKLIADLEQWATGQETRPAWCEHWHWEDKGGGGGWYREFPTHFIKAGEDYDLCPVTGCHAPRPQEPGCGVAMRIDQHQVDTLFKSLDPALRTPPGADHA